MKSFTAKEFSRCPAKVYEAAREDGSVEITHDRFEGKFMLCKVNSQRYEYDKASESVITEEYLSEFNKRMALAIRAELNKKAPD